MRFRRLFDESGAIIAVPLDHGFTLGPIKGVAAISDTVDAVFAGGASTVVVQKGNVRFLTNIPPAKGVMVHISGSVSFSPHATEKVLTGSVQDAVYLGADGVSVHVNVGCTQDKTMLADLAKVTGDADKFGMPVLAMMYARNDEGNDDRTRDVIAHVVRIAQESGADIAKVNITENPKEFDEVVQGVDIPVVIAGGSKTADFAAFLDTIRVAIENGASGVSIGRNIFQADQIEEATQRVVATVRAAMQER